MIATVQERQASLAAEFSPWSPMALHEMLDIAAQRHGSAPYIISGQQVWTYAQVRDWSRRIASGLADLGCGDGDKVAIILANYAEFAALKFAISRVGAVAVPINMLNRSGELRYLLEQSDSRLLVTMNRFRDNDYMAALDEISPDWQTDGGGEALPRLRNVVVFDTGEDRMPANVLRFDDLLAEQPFPERPVAPQANCDIIYTSGTTGAPKGVLLTHDMVTRTAFSCAHARAFEPGHRIVFSLPMYHVFGYVEGLLAVPWVGGAIVPQLRFDPDETLAAIERTKASDVLLIPTMTLAVLDAAQERKYDLSSLHFALASGGRAPARIWPAIYDILGITEVTTGYGMTETTATTMMTRPDDPSARVASTNGRFRDVGPVGDPSIGGRLVDYLVIDTETGTPLPANSTGELVARGAGVTAGYYNKPAETAAAFTEDGWLRTGDLGRIDEEGYLTLMGRSKESYRCGGELVMPTEVEDLLTSQSEVLQAHVVPVPDERMGEVGVAFVVPAPNATLDPEALKKLVGEHVARYKVPRHFLLVGETDIPVTASGRARKFQLIARAIELLELA
jgi:fatty-acyl-CoA synthase